MICLLLLAGIRITAAERIVAGARSQLTSPSTYDGGYFALKYPGGDPPPDRGACTDVVIRALRPAGYDLQRLIHEDAKDHPYPRIKKLDYSIDHRRCPNQMVYFARYGKKLPINQQFAPGDIVFWKLPGGLDHVGVVSDAKAADGDWKVIHNVRVCEEAPFLHAWTIVGHFRFP